MRDAEPVLGLSQTFTVTTGGFGRLAPVAYRDGVCDRLRVTGGTALRPEVWLGPDAPADILARLARAGLVVTGDVRAGTARDRLDAQGRRSACGSTSRRGSSPSCSVRSGSA